MIARQMQKNDYNSINSDWVNRSNRSKGNSKVGSLWAKRKLLILLLSKSIIFFLFDRPKIYENTYFNIKKCFKIIHIVPNFGGGTKRMREGGANYFKLFFKLSAPRQNLKYRKKCYIHIKSSSICSHSYLHFTGWSEMLKMYFYILWRV